MSEPAKESVLALLRDEGLALINRRTLKSVALSPLDRAELEAATKSPDCTPPTWLPNAFEAIGAKFAAQSWIASITMRPKCKFDFRRIAWEITERCNFRCVHLLPGPEMRARITPSEADIIT